MQSPLHAIHPNTRDYRSYTDHLFAYNKMFQKNLSASLAEAFGIETPCYAIATTGSDARLEKGPASYLEMVLFLDTHAEGCASSLNILKGLGNFIFRQDGQAYSIENMEVKDLENDRMSECILNPGTAKETRLISPNRVFDARFLYGFDAVFSKAKGRLATELSNDENSYGEKLYDRIKSRAKDHRRIVLTGVQRFKGDELRHYDLSSGVAFYNPSEHLWAFKQGPLRAVQYALVRDQIRVLREGVDPQMILELPRNTVVKLNALEVENASGLSSDQIQELSDHYKYFLWLYHKSQSAHLNDKSSQITFDAAEASKRCKSLDTLCAGQIIKAPERIIIG